MSLSVRFVDNHLLAVEKPACLPVVPDESGDESLFDRAREWVEVEYQKPGRAFLGVVHRLDRPVSGVVLFARTSKAASRLTDQFRERTVEKTYLAVCEGRMAHEVGRMEQWLVKDRGTNRVRAGHDTDEGAKRALTRWKVLASEGNRHLVELVPETGRSHQLRVALSSLGAPILGDLKYGARDALADRSIALHARSLAVDHPTLRDRRVLASEVPAGDWWRLAREHLGGE